MKIPLVNLNRQYLELKNKIDFNVGEVLKNGNFILGKEVSDFEQEFAKFCGTKYCLGVSSGWDGIHLSLKALGIGKGDEVIVQDNTFVASVFPIIETGAKPVLVDINKDTYQINIDLIEKAITKKTKAILPVHLYGIPAEMDKILKVARKYNLYVIEDACQAHGVMYRSKHCGTFGDIGVFSFYPGKNLGAAGDAGAVITNKKDIYEKIRILRDVGQNEKYHHMLIGYNNRLDTLQAAILSLKLKKLKIWNKKRIAIAESYDRLLSDLPISLSPQSNVISKNNYHLYVIRTSQRDELFNYLKKNGIYCGIHYPIPVHLQKAVKFLGYKKGDFPVTEKYAKEILSLPIFPQLKEVEVQYISNIIHKFFRK